MNKTHVVYAIAAAIAVVTIGAVVLKKPAASESADVVCNGFNCPAKMSAADVERERAAWAPATVAPHPAFHYAPAGKN